MGWQTFRLIMNQGSFVLGAVVSCPDEFRVQLHGPRAAACVQCHVSSYSHSHIVPSSRLSF